MRYIRFLKPPRKVSSKDSRTPVVSTLITITSDLGDSFLQRDIELCVDLVSCHDHSTLHEQIVRWKARMRCLEVTIPIRKDHGIDRLQLHIGTKPRREANTLEHLSQIGTCGVMSAWSAPIGYDSNTVLERRFDLGKEGSLSIYEETGESIARHVWDAGITLAFHIGSLLTSPSIAALQTKAVGCDPLLALELGSGCGFVGIALSHVITNIHVLLTDLVEAEEIARKNIKQNKRPPATGSGCEFRVLDWNDNASIPVPVHRDGKASTGAIDYIVAADCTYNADSSPSLVNTVRRFADNSPSLIFVVAMKKRHSSEDVFFDLMEEARFEIKHSVEIPLPGDSDPGEEIVHVFAYQLRA